MEAPFKNWYAIVDGGCWYVGMHLDREAAKEQAIRMFHVQLSKASYCIVERAVLEIISNIIKAVLEQDKE
jgi:hypothetical protein